MRVSESNPSLPTLPTDRATYRTIMEGAPAKPLKTRLDRGEGERAIQQPA